MTIGTAETMISNAINDILHECVANSYENRQNRSVIDMPDLNLILYKAKERLVSQFSVVIYRDQYNQNAKEDDWEYEETE